MWMVWCTHSFLRCRAVRFTVRQTERLKVCIVRVEMEGHHERVLSSLLPRWPSLFDSKLI